jgi:hypothetical protein
MKQGALFLMILATTAFCAEPWKLSLELKGSLAFSHYSNDWAEEDAEGALTWVARLDAGAEKQIGSKLNSRTILKLEFGQTKAPGEVPVKSSDAIELESVLKATLGGWVDPFISARGESRFVDKTHPHERYVNPVKVSEALGAARTLWKTDAVVWDVRLGAAAKQGIDRWQPANDWETVVTSDGGIELVTELNAVLPKEVVKLKSVLRVYEALLRADSDTIPDSWRYPDVNWETTLGLTVVKYLMLGYTVELDYDREGDANLQHRHLFTVGVTVSARRPKEKKAEA